MEVADKGGVIGWDKIVEHPRAAAGAHAPGAEYVLVHERDARQGALLALLRKKRRRHHQDPDAS